MRPFSTIPLLALAAVVHAGPVTSPERQFGHPIGADYVLPNYRALSEYWKKLDRESDRMRLVSIGRTAEGREQLMAVVSSPANLRRLERYKGIAQRLAKAKGLTEADARRLAQEGKTVVWIDGGLHANEVLGPQQLMETLYQMLSRNDAETRRILDECIVLFVHANPDGMDLVSDWYMRRADPEKRSTADVPRLYQKYIGHDDNRDFFLVSQRETENMSRVQYREWFPQIVYNHHQTGPRGAVIYCPPFRAPFNPNVDALATAETDLVGQAIHNRLIAEGKGGSVREGGASYSSWWNGGLRTTAYFHNMVGILTETIGNPTPTRVPLVAARQLSTGDLLLPVAPGEWHFGQSVEYSVSANYALMTLAAQKREEFLFNVWRMGMNSVERGSRDHWTVRPKWIEGGDAALAARLTDPAMRDARAYVIPADQMDFPTAVEFANALIKSGVEVGRATASFGANGRTFPAGSLIVRCDQAYRPHVLDMFEPQDHPNDIVAPGANPTPPYDAAGWTLAFQMGIAFERVLEPLDAPTEPVRDVMKPPAGSFSKTAGTYTLSPAQNNAFTAVQRVLSAGGSVYRNPDGRFNVPLGGKSDEVLEKASRELGVNISPGDGIVPHSVKPVRLGLWDRYGGSMPSGWIRWILEKYEIPYTRVYAQELDAGDLERKFDVLIFPDGATFGSGRFGAPDDVPEEYRKTVGAISSAKTAPALRKFMEAGGRVVTIGSATGLAKALDLPVEDALVDAVGKPLPRSTYYVPGSILQARVDRAQPVAFGMPERADFTFDNSPTFRFGKGAEEAGLKRVVWFDTDALLRSGWAWGQAALKDGIAAFTAPIGRGTLYAFGPEITFRAQPAGTFRLLFNAIYAGGG